MDPVYVDSNTLANMNNSGNCLNRTNNINNLGIGNINLNSSSKNVSSNMGGTSSSSNLANSSPESSRLKLNSSIVNSPLCSLINSNSRMSPHSGVNTNKKYSTSGYSSSNGSSPSSLKQSNSAPSVKQQYLWNLFVLLLSLDLFYSKFTPQWSRLRSKCFSSRLNYVIFHLFNSAHEIWEKENFSRRIYSVLISQTFLLLYLVEIIFYLNSVLKDIPNLSYLFEDFRNHLYFSDLHV